MEKRNSERKSSEKRNVKKKHPKTKLKLHPRNRHRGRYDLSHLQKVCPELKAFVIENDYGDESIDFFNADAVKMLNKALLIQYYEITSWDIPEGYLCPPVPGRADYIHNISDVLASANYGRIPIGKNVVCLDIGVGSNCIYPIIGTNEYEWSFIGTDIDKVAVESAQNIVNSNELLSKTTEIRLQEDPKVIFKNIIKEGELIDFVICNPPFHSSKEEAEAGTFRKLKNLKKDDEIETPERNFAGQNNELWCEGGEKQFVQDIF